jgi:transposase
MAAPLVSDGLWTIVEPLLPPTVLSPKGGRPPVPNRDAFTGIVFVLKTGLPWNALPQEMGCGSGSTCWRRFAAWTRSGVWEQSHQAVLNQLGHEGGIDWSRAVIDSASVRALLGGRTPGRTRRTGPRTAANAT